MSGAVNSIYKLFLSTGVVPPLGLSGNEYKSSLSGAPVSTVPALVDDVPPALVAPLAPAVPRQAICDAGVADTSSDEEVPRSSCRRYYGRPNCGARCCTSACTIFG